MIKHYVELSFPGVLCSETCVKEVKERSQDLLNFSEGFFAYRFFDITYSIVNGIELASPWHTISPTTFIGEEYTLDRIKGELAGATTLISNMEDNGWGRVVKTKHGAFYPVPEGDRITSSTPDKEEDFWREKAAEHFGISIKEVTKQQRSFAKDHYFGENYSMNSMNSFSRGSDHK